MAEAKGFEFGTAIIIVDDCQEYDETRYIAYGYIADRLHVLVFTMRNAERRIISLRKANSKEKIRYEKQVQKF